MEHFLYNIDQLLTLIAEVEILNEECHGVTRIAAGEDGELLVYSWTEFTTSPEEAENAFREHLLPTRGWSISPYSKARAREALQRRKEALEELGIEC